MSSRRVKSTIIFEKLAKAYPDADCELNFTNPLELLVATVLSAQSTDTRVNQVTPALFNRYRTAHDYAEADSDGVEEVIRPTGFFCNKAQSLIGIGRELVKRFDGQVPADLESLVSLPGVGRKTANVVLGHAFGIPGITPDTHVMRVSKRLGLTKESKPDKVEKDLAVIFNTAVHTKLSDVLIFHGRRCCHARKAACGVCPVANLCPSFGEGPTDSREAAKLVKKP